MFVKSNELGMSGSLISSAPSSPAEKVIPWAGRGEQEQSGPGGSHGGSMLTQGTPARARSYGSTGAKFPVATSPCPPGCLPAPLLSAGTPISLTSPASRDQQLALTFPSSTSSLAVEQEPWTCPQGSTQGHRPQPGGPHGSAHPGQCQLSAQEPQRQITCTVQVLGHAARQ